MLLLSVKKNPSFIKSQKISVRSSYTLRDLLDNFFIRLPEALEKKGFNSMLDWSVYQEVQGMVETPSWQISLGDLTLAQAKLMLSAI